MLTLNQEFSDEFDVIYDNITSHQAAGLNEYEKSVFLSKAQIDVLLSYFDPRSNKLQEGFDGSQRRQIDFSNITKTEVYNSPSKFDPALFDPRDNSKSVRMPGNILMMLNERLVVTRNNSKTFLTVVPIQYHEYDRLMSKPLKRPLKYQAWRVFNYDESKVNKADLVVGPKDIISEYAFRYVKRPNPIILTDFTDEGVSIEGYSKEMACELDPIIHHEIIQRAVEFAKAAYTGDLNSQLALGNTSQTDIGVVPQARQ